MSGAEYPRGPYASYIDVGKYLAKVSRRGLTTAERTVMYVLGNMANQDGICWPTQAYLMERTGASLKTLLKCLHGLRALGWISYGATAGKVKTSCTYTVHPERGRQRTTSRSPLERAHRPPPAKKGPRKPVIREVADIAPNGTSDMAIGAISDQVNGARSTWQSVPDKSLQSRIHLEETTEEWRSPSTSYKSSPSSMDSGRARDLDKDLDHVHDHPLRRGPVWNKGVFLDRWESGYPFAHHQAVSSLVIGEGHLAVARRKGLDPVQEVALFLATMHESRNWPRAFMTWLERDDGRKQRLNDDGVARPPERGLVRMKLVELYFAGLDPMFPGEDRAFAPHRYDPNCPCELCELGFVDPPPDP